MLDALTDDPHCDRRGGSLGLGPLDCGRLPWHVVRFEPNAEGLLLPALRRMGVQVFLPLLRLSVPDRRLGKRVVTVPAFPGCAFACWPDGFVWQRILSQPGVMGGPAGIIRPVGDPHGHPQPVPQAYMDDLMLRASALGVIEDASVAPELPPIAPGVPVRIRSGPFAGHTGLSGQSSGQRLAVLFEIMGATRTVTARRRDVEPA